MNNTSTPVYNVVITIVFIQGAGPRDGKSVPSSWRYRYISPILPPEQHSCFIDFAGLYGMHARFGVEIAFTDCLNRNWVRSAQGKLIQIKFSPYTYLLFNASRNFFIPFIHRLSRYNPIYSMYINTQKATRNIAYLIAYLLV